MHHTVLLCCMPNHTPKHTPNHTPNCTPCADADSYRSNSRTAAYPHCVLAMLTRGEVAAVLMGDFTTRAAHLGGIGTHDNGLVVASVLGRYGGGCCTAALYRRTCSPPGQNLAILDGTLLERSQPAILGSSPSLLHALLYSQPAKKTLNKRVWPEQPHMPHPQLPCWSSTPPSGVPSRACAFSSQLPFYLGLKMAGLTFLAQPPFHSSVVGAA